MTKVPVILCDEWSPAQVKAFRLIVNRSVSWASWDDELLALELQELKKVRPTSTYLKRGGANQTLQATALINEAWLRLLGPSPAINWENRANFFGIAALLMRIALVDRARERQAMKRGGSVAALTLEQITVL